MLLAPEQIFGFLAAAMLITVSPGPDNLMVLGIGISRFVNEFFRQPDAQLADFAARTGLSMGQWLTIPLILTGLTVVLFALRKPPLGTGTTAPA